MTESRNQETAEARDLCQRSEFIRRVEDFARYMQKEYIDDDDDMALLVCAIDRSIGGDQVGAANIVLGEKDLMVRGLSEMMGDQRMRMLFRVARAASSDVDGGLSEVIAERRSRLRTFYRYAAMCGLWAAVLIAFGVAGIVHWTITITNIFLMSLYGLLTYREIREQRRRLARLLATERKDLEDKAAHRMATMISQMQSRMRHGEDEE